LALGIEGLSNMIRGDIFVALTWLMTLGAVFVVPLA
jgi:hypothetical protein